MRVIIAGRLSRKVADRDQTGFDSQERESVRWAEARGHEVVAVVADFKSGRSGIERRPNLRPWVTEPDKLARYDAIVALKVDRLTRGNRAETRELEQWATDHGKELWITEADVHFPSEGVDGIQWDMMLRLAHQEWLNISERYLRMQRNRREVGSAVGLAPWGYRIARREDGRKFFALTEEGRSYLPAIFERIIAGDSLLTVARWLTAEDVRTLRGARWNEGYIGNTLVKNPIYYGARRNGGQLETEGAVSFAVWQEANAVLASRPRVGRSTVARPKPLVKPLCGACYGQERDGCPSGRSPMYVTTTGRATSRKAYFRCAGHGPQRKGCGGNMVPVADLDAVVTDAVLAARRKHIDRSFVPGDDRSDEIARLRERGSEALRKGDYNAATAAMREAAEMESQPRVAPHWETRETEQSEADYFASLNQDQQRDYFARCEIKAWCSEIKVWRSDAVRRTVIADIKTELGLSILGSRRI
jgi:DNA invertase Pin-like site-specific DNA recombinase